MDRRKEEEEIRTENWMGNLSEEIPMNISLSDIFDMPCEGEKGSYMELLGIQQDNLGSCCNLFDDLPPISFSTSSSLPPHSLINPSPASTSDAPNTNPTTPNSSSISSSSNDDHLTKPPQHQQKDEDADLLQDQEKTHKQSVFIVSNSSSTSSY